MEEKREKQHQMEQYRGKCHELLDSENDLSMLRKVYTMLIYRPKRVENCAGANGKERQKNE